MFGLFKRKPKVKQPPQLLDLDGNLIEEGDRIMAFRYEIGECVVLLEGLQYFYESEQSYN